MEIHHSKAFDSLVPEREGVELIDIIGVHQNIIGGKVLDVIENAGKSRDENGYVSGVIINDFFSYAEKNCISKIETFLEKNDQVSLAQADKIWSFMEYLDTIAVSLMDNMNRGNVSAHIESIFNKDDEGVYDNYEGFRQSVLSCKSLLIDKLPAECREEFECNKIEHDDISVQ